MHDVAISKYKQRWRLTKVESERSMLLGRKKKGRAQQLQDTRANRTFSAAKQPDKAEMQPCVATADDELATPWTPATVPGTGGGVGSRTVAQVMRQGGRKASMQGWRI